MIKEIDGVKINYVCQGEGELVLLLHGWGANLTLWNDTINLLSQKYKVLALDFAGFGESEEPPRSWNVDDYTNMTLEFLKDYDFDKITLFAHSFGGRVVIKMCSMDLPFKVEKTVLVDIAGVKPEKSAEQLKREKRYKQAKKILLSKPVKTIAPNALDKLQSKTGSADYKSASPVMRESLVKVVNEDLTHLMKNVDMPTLLIWGTNDDATPLSDGKLMETLMPEAALVEFAGAGHYSFLDARNQYLRVVASFMGI
ncbi:MAG: alpha/beta hydrolase [Clostridia bacterium]